MNNLLEQSYQFELVSADSKLVKYDFVSVGEKEVPKRVVIVAYEELPGYFNIGFGNLFITEDGSEFIEDMSKANNKGDVDKLLITVFACGLDFLSTNPNSKLTFFGNTRAKHRLYKMRINANLFSIQEFFEIKGGIIQEIEIRETEEGKEFPSGIDLSTFQYENYAVGNSNLYSFITFELKEEYK
ncbi:MAG: hypothetical protein H6581_24400 [Bacteroidia bacterium]|nr:hypothetical protein [Bacteroidia bacterium]